MMSRESVSTCVFPIWAHRSPCDTFDVDDMLGAPSKLLCLKVNTVDLLLFKVCQGTLQFDEDAHPFQDLCQFAEPGKGPL